MADTWLAMCQQAADVLGISRPSSITAGSDMARQLGAMANTTGNALMRRRTWTALQAEWVLTPSRPLVTTCTTVSGSPIVTAVGSLADVEDGLWVCAAAGLEQRPRVLTVDSATQATLDTPCGVSGTAVPITFYRDMYAPPAGFLNFVAGAAWDRTQRWQLLGPTSPHTDEALRSGALVATDRVRYRRVGRDASFMRLFPAPDRVPPALLVWEYQTSYWAQSAAGAAQARFAADTDVCVFPDDIMSLGIQWLFLRSKGMEYAGVMADFERAVSLAISDDGGGASLPLDLSHCADDALWEPSLTAPSESGSGGAGDGVILAEDESAILA